MCRTVCVSALHRKEIPVPERASIYTPDRGFSTYLGKSAYGVAGMRVVRGGVYAAN